MKLKKVLNIVLWVLIGVSVILVVSLMSNISDVETDPTMGSWINTNLAWVYILFFAAAGLAVLFGIIHTLTDAKALKGALVALVFMAVVGVIAYFLADGSIPQFYGVEKYVAKGELTPTISKWIGTTLYGTYILFFIAVISMIVSPLVKLFK